MFTLRLEPEGVVFIKREYTSSLPLSRPAGLCVWFVLFFHSFIDGLLNLIVCMMAKHNVAAEF